MLFYNTPFQLYECGIRIADFVLAMASNFYRAADKPKYILGHGLELGFVAAGLIAVLALRFNYDRINKSRDKEGMGMHTEAEMSDMGDRAPTFRYVL